MGEFCIAKDPPVRHTDDPILINIPPGLWYGLAATTVSIDNGPVIRPFHVFKVCGPKRISLKYLVGPIAGGDEPQITLGFYFTDDLCNLLDGLKLRLSTEGYMQVQTEGTITSFRVPIWTGRSIDQTDLTTQARIRLVTKFSRPSGPCPLFFMDPLVYGALVPDVSYEFHIRHAHIYNLSSTGAGETAAHIVMGPRLYLPGGGEQRARHVVAWVTPHYVLRAPPAIGHLDGSYGFKGDDEMLLIWNLIPEAWEAIYPMLELMSSHNVAITFYGSVIVPAITSKIMEA